ncbi:MAG: hypothetical protein ABIQ32_01825 [Sphingomicrobium sp.]
MVEQARQDWARALPLILALIIFAALSFAPALFNDGDTSWHLATGRWIIAHRAIPHADPFSFTFRGHAWTAHEWLVDVAMAAAFALRGWAALALLFAFSIAAALGLIARELVRSHAPRHAVAAVAVTAWVLSPFVLARPHVVTWPLLALWTLALLRAREAGRAPPLAWALLILLWANLHASFLFALLLAAFFGLEALVMEKGRRREVIVGWGAFGAACAVAALLTPHGLQGYLYPLQVSGMKALPLIGEWRATNLRDGWPFVLFTFAVLLALVLRWRAVGAVRLLLLAFLAALAFAHARHQPLFAIVAVLIAARLPASGGKLSPLPRNPALVLLAGALLVSMVRLAIPLQRGDSPTYPATALAKLPPELRTRPVLNDYSFGGPLILNDIAPYIDGRSDMYGDAFTIDHHSMIMGDRAALQRAQQRWKLEWTILNPDAPLVKVLDSNPEWRRLYADQVAVVHVRPAT